MTNIRTALSAKRKRVLIVEDQLIVTRDLRNRLNDLGYIPVAETAFAEESITLAERLQPDLILMDIRLAGEMDGVEAASIIGERFHLPVVFLTAHAEDATLDRAKQAEPYGYIVKPFEDRELRTVIELALHKHGTEKALWASQQEMATILRTAMDGFCIIDADGRILEVNEAACQMGGYSREELLSLSVTDLDLGGTAEDMLRSLEEVRQAGKNRFELNLLHKTGRAVVVEASINYLEQGGGRFFCFLRDITERRRHVQALRASQASLAHAQAIAHLGSWELQFEKGQPTNELRWSDEVYRIFGYSPGEVEISRSFFKGGLPDEDRQVLEKAFDEALAGRIDYEVHHRVVRPSGEERFVTERAEIIRDENGVPLRMLGTVHDVTEARRAQQALYSMQFAVEHSADSIFWIAEDSRITYVNQAACEFLGYPREELLRMSICEVDPRITPEQFSLRWNNLRQLKNDIAEAVYRTRDGRLLPVEVRASHVVFEGREFQCAFARDISDRKAAEWALQQREAELAAIYEHAPIVMCLLDADQRVLRVNRAGRLLVGGLEDSVVNQWLGELLEPNVSREDLREPAGVQDHHALPLQLAIADTLQTGRSHTGIESRTAIPSSKGRRQHHLVAHTAALRIGGESRVLLCLEDVTDKKAAQAQLEETSNVLRVLLANLQTGTMVEDENGKLLHLNQKFCDLLAVPQAPESLLGSGSSSLKQSAARMFLADAAFVSRIEQLMQAEESVTGEELPLKDGRVFARDYAPIVLGGGRPAHLWSYRDITGQKHSEQRLRQQAALLQAAHDSILVAEVSGPIQFVNPAAGQLLGLEPVQCIGKPLEEVLRTRSDLQLRLAVKEARTSGEWSGELNLRTLGGHERVVDSRWARIQDAAMGAESLLIICNDVTEKKQLEAQYLRAQRLESVGTLASGVAHDLNNVLSPILMGLEVLGDACPSKEARSMLSIMKESATRGKDTVLQLLTFARGTASQKGPVQLRHLMQEVVRLLRQTFPKNIQIFADYPTEPFTVLADPSQLHQVLMNLCVNARDAMPEGGVLSVTLENDLLELSSVRLHPKAKPGPYAVVKVADSGTGIPPEILDRIFDPFFTTKPQGKGTGLGLATVLGIVGSHGGFVLVDSKPSQGSTFTVYLPAAAAEITMAVETPEKDNYRGIGELVLVVDDEPAILRVAENLLQLHGYRTLTAGNSADALTLFQSHRQDLRLVLTDVMMPFGDGRQLISTMRALDPNLPIVAISGLAGRQTQGELVLCGASVFLPKPFTSQELLRTLHKLLRRDGVHGHNGSG